MDPLGDSDVGLHARFFSANKNQQIVIGFLSPSQLC